ncbi:hypothetical protein OGAPHI_003013 [Ogataea philodendri]|uniref:Uncharacterized protein n=1 Tax=Ogataea philodendri TaxID=1378263 RepID=A0A9P8P9V7_9ASCO|nr:uncharacterized protein OGAPHI_003013 [Ogataea philodendri]KAH3667364.1 hypothetical protein OGAPHI_003013 [Ogataea philodendri]
MFSLCIMRNGQWLLDFHESITLQVKGPLLPFDGEIDRFSGSPTIMGSETCSALPKGHSCGDKSPTELPAQVTEDMGQALLLEDEVGDVLGIQVLWFPNALRPD